MAEALYYLPKGSRILVTGANGFVGSNVIHNLLELGFRVRGTIRAAKPWLDRMFQDKFGQDSYESVILTSFESVDTLFEVLDGVSGVAHVVCDFIRGVWNLRGRTWLTLSIGIGNGCQFQFEYGGGYSLGSESCSESARGCIKAL
jgi:hypothetical protein